MSKYSTTLELNNINLIQNFPFLMINQLEASEKMPQTVHNPFKNLQDLKKNGCGFLIYDEELNIPIYLLFFPDFY